MRHGWWRPPGYVSSISGREVVTNMTEIDPDKIDPELKILARKRFIQLATWAEIILHGSEDERRRLAETLTDVDLWPLLTTLDEDEEVVRTEASEQRTILALEELRRMSAEAIAVGDLDAAARWLDLRLSVEGWSG